MYVHKPIRILTFLKRNYTFTGYISSWVSSELCINFAHVNRTLHGFDWVLETMVQCTTIQPKGTLGVTRSFVDKLRSSTPVSLGLP